MADVAVETTAIAQFRIVGRFRLHEGGDVFMIHRPSPAGLGMAVVDHCCIV
jgi:hypothetical protein